MLRFLKLCRRYIWPAVVALWKHRNHDKLLYVWSGVVWEENAKDVQLALQAIEATKAVEQK